MKELLLIRHGESQYNALLTDSLDSQLTPLGIAQARSAGKFLREHFGHIQSFVGVTSPYLRCLQTSKLIQEETGIEFSVNPGPREIMMKYDPVTICERSEQFPEFIWNVPCPSMYWKDKGWEFPTESAEHFVGRLETFIGSCEQEKLLIVSHGTPVSTMYELRLGIKAKPDTVNYVTNASVTYIRDKEGIWFGKKVHE